MFWVWLVNTTIVLCISVWSARVYVLICTLERKSPTERVSNCKVVKMKVLISDEFWSPHLKHIVTSQHSEF